MLVEVEKEGEYEIRRSYDLLGQLLRQQDANAQGIMLQDLKYEYNEVGQIVREQKKQYTYDQLRRLVSEENQGKITYYRYGLGGNLKKQEQQGNLEQRESQDQQEKRGQQENEEQQEHQEQRVQQVGQLQFTTEKDHSFSYSVKVKSLHIMCMV